MVWAKVVARIIAVLLVGGVIEGCLLRDPWVEVGNGYNIGAISWGSPCHLTYFKSQDNRPASPWSVVDAGDSFALVPLTVGVFRTRCSGRPLWRPSGGEAAALYYLS